MIFSNDRVCACVFPLGPSLACCRSNAKAPHLRKTSLVYTALAMHIKELIIDGFKSYANRTVVTGWDQVCPFVLLLLIFLAV
jgi:hypothetical protein